jgi:hypothetical protein
MLLVFAVFAAHGINDKSVGSALQLTARWSFLLFWIAYTGRALGILFGRTFAPLASRRREFGLAFAAAMQGHFALLAGIFLITHRPPLTGWLLVLFLTAACWTYFLAISSFGVFARILNSNRWNWLRTVGVNFIWFAFARDFVLVLIHSPIHYGRWRLYYAPWALLAIAAPSLVLAASIPDRWRTSLTRRWFPPDNLVADRYRARDFDTVKRPTSML